MPRRRPFPVAIWKTSSALVLAGFCVCAAGPMRTGLNEVGLRAWTVARTDRDSGNADQHLVGISIARFLNDNISLGIEAATFDATPFSDSLVVDIRVRLYWWPLSRFTPWTELRAGGAFGMPEGNATRYGGAFGLRWVPSVLRDQLALDLQLVGCERWRQDWAAEYVEPTMPSGRIDWSMSRSPWPTPKSGILGHTSPLAWPVVGVEWLF